MNKYIGLISIFFILLTQSSVADTSSSLNLSLPGMPQNYQSDRFKAGDLDCSNAIGSATQLEYGVTGIINQGDSFNTNNNLMKDIGVYARIVVPLGKKVKSRIDCNRLYELELRKKQLEVMKLEAEIKRLRELEFEN